MKQWIVCVQMPGKKSFWAGTFEAVGRTEAKRAASLFVAEYLPLDAKTIAIAEGSVTVKFDGPKIPFDEADL